MVKLENKLQFPRLSLFSSKISILVFISLSNGIYLLGKVAPESIYKAYAFPSGYIASFFLGSPPVVDARGELFIPLSGQFIHIIKSCSGFGFFCLFYAFVVSFFFRPLVYPAIKKPGVRLVVIILALPLVYAITVFTNASRIICAYHAGRIGRLIFPANFQAALHQGVGIAVFLTVLILTAIFLERMVKYEQCRG